MRVPCAASVSARTNSGVRRAFARAAASACTGFRCTRGIRRLAAPPRRDCARTLAGTCERENEIRAAARRTHTVQRSLVLALRKHSSEPERVRVYPYEIARDV
jgi:hypothetical protein